MRMFIDIFSFLNPDLLVFCSKQTLTIVILKYLQDQKQKQNNPFLKNQRKTKHQNNNTKTNRQTNKQK